MGEELARQGRAKPEGRAKQKMRQEKQQGIINHARYDGL